MNRALSTIRHDMRLQFRHGFYHVGAFVAVAWAAILWQFPPDWTARLLPAFVFLALNVTTFYFIAGLVLFEKGQGTLEALSITPLRPGEYLLSKVLSLGFLAVAENVILVFTVFGAPEGLFSFFTGLVTLCGIYTLLGFVIVVRYDSINEYLMPSTLYTLVIQAPVAGALGLFETDLFRLWPTNGPLVLLSDAFSPVSTEMRVYGLVFSVFCCVALFFPARKAFDRFVARRQGGL